MIAFNKNKNKDKNGNQNENKSGNDNENVNKNGNKNGDWEQEKLLKKLNALNHRYLLDNSAQEIMEHLNLYRNLKENNCLWTVKSESSSEVRTITICGKDRPGFYSKLAGVFFLNGLDIVASQAYALIDDCALDIFKVMPPKDRIFENEKWEKTKRELQQAINDDTFLDRLKEKLPKTIVPASGQAPMPNCVRIDNETSSFFTIIEVFTHDFPGILFIITNTLYRLGLDVRVAIVATKIDQVVDVFYVRYADNGKIDDPAEEIRMKQAILDALPSVEKHEQYNTKNQNIIAL